MYDSNWNSCMYRLRHFLQIISNFTLSNQSYDFLFMKSRYFWGQETKFKEVRYVYEILINTNFHELVGLISHSTYKHYVIVYFWHVHMREPKLGIFAHFGRWFKLKLFLCFIENCTDFRLNTICYNFPNNFKWWDFTKNLHKYNFSSKTDGDSDVLGYVMQSVVNNQYLK